MEIKNYNGGKIFLSYRPEMAASGDLTTLLKAWGRGDRTAFDRLMPLMYAEIRQLARGYMKRERPGNSLQTTALINEAYLKLVNVKDVDWRDHSSEGIMKARWTNAEIKGMIVKPLSFAPEDIQLIHAGLAARPASLRRHLDAEQFLRFTKGD